MIRANPNPNGFLGGWTSCPKSQWVVKEMWLLPLCFHNSLAQPRDMAAPYGPANRLARHCDH